MILIKRLFLLQLFIIAFVCMFHIYGSIANAAEKQILTVEEIKKKAENYLISTLPWDKDSVEIEIQYQGGKIFLPTGQKELIFKGLGGTQKIGRIPMILEVRVNGKFQQRIRINSRIVVLQNVIKTIRTIKRGEIFSEENIKLTVIKTDRLYKNAIEKLDHAIGYEAKTIIPNGKILTQRIVKKPALGNKGDKILILAEKGIMKITAPGILKEDGYKNAMVRVLNMESRKIIYGRLVDSNTVKVNF